MFERRMSALVAAVLVLLASAVLWNLFVRPAPRARSPATPESQVESVVASPAPGAADTAVRLAPTRQAGPPPLPLAPPPVRSEEHTSELQSRSPPVCRLLLEKKHSK